MSQELKPARLVPTGFGTSKEEKEGLIIDYSTRAEAGKMVQPLSIQTLIRSGALLRGEPTGSILLSLDKDLSSKKAELFLSYKYNKFIFHKTLRKVEVHVKKTKDDSIICKTDIKSYRFIKSNLLQFAEKLHRWILAVVHNKNWVEKELNQEEQEREISFREFVIFPSRDTITILQKVPNKDKKESTKSASILIDVDRCYFVVDTKFNESQDDFNRVLLDFLRIKDVTKSFLVKQMLGYDLPQLEKFIEQNPHQSLGKRTLMIAKHSILDSKEKLYYLSAIGLSLEVLNPYNLTEYPEEVRTSLEAICDSVKDCAETKQTEVDKFDWVKKGIFPTIFKILTLCGKATFPTRFVLPLQICEGILKNHLSACHVFYKSFWSALLQYSDDINACVGLCEALASLIHVHPLADVFVSESGVTRLVQLYKQFTVIQKGKILIPFSVLPKNNKYEIPYKWESSSEVSKGGYQGDTKSIDLLPEIESKEEQTDETKTEETEKTSSTSKTDETTFSNENSSSQSSSVTEEETPNRTPNPTPKRLDWIPLIMIPDTSIVKKDVKSKKGDEEIIKDLAKKLGEGYISAELTILLKLKAIHDTKKEMKSVSSYPSKPNLVLTNELKKETVDDETQLPIQIIKNRIFQVLEKILSPSNSRVRIPVNMLFSEVLSSYNELVYDKASRATVLKVMSNVASYVEIQHMKGWNKLTKAMTPKIQQNFRKKIDLFIFRIHSRLCCSFQNQDWNEITTQLIILGDYLGHCKTRVMSAQVVDVALDTLLQIKSWLIRTQYISDTNIENYQLAYALLRVFDNIVNQNVLGPFNDLMLTLLLYKEKAFNWFKAYSEAVLINTHFQEKIVQKHGEEYLIEMKVATLEHYKSCVRMINREFRSDEGTTAAIATKIALIKKMDFLTYPDAILQQILTADDEQKNFKVHNECLNLIHKILCIREKELPLLDDSAYLDSYIRFHYIHFLRLYHNYSIENWTLELCRKHLRVLTDFAKQKNERIKRKFYQLKVMDFMAHMINLEYDVQILASHVASMQREQLANEKLKEQQEKQAQAKLLAKEQKKPKKVIKPPSSSSSSSTSSEERPPKKVPVLSGFKLKDGQEATKPVIKKVEPQLKAYPGMKPKFALAGFQTKTGEIKNTKSSSSSSTSGSASSSTEDDTEEEGTTPTEGTPHEKDETTPPAKQALPPKKGLPLLTGFKTKTGEIKAVEQKEPSSSSSATRSTESSDSNSQTSSSSSSSSSEDNRQKKKPGLPTLSGFKTKTGATKILSPSAVVPSSSSSSSSSAPPTPKKKTTLPLLSGFKTKTGETKIVTPKAVEPSSSSSSTRSSSESDEPPKKKPGLPLLAGFKTKTGETKIAPLPIEKEETSTSSSSSESEQIPKKKPALPMLAGFKTKTVSSGETKILSPKPEPSPKQEPSSSSSSSEESSSSSSSSPSPKKKPGLPMLSGFKTKTGEIKKETSPPPKTVSSSSSSISSSSSLESPPPNKPAFSLAGFKTKTGEIKIQTVAAPASSSSDTSSSSSSSSTEEEQPKKKPIMPLLTGFKTKTGDTKILTKAVSSASSSSSSSEEEPKSKKPTLSGFKLKTGEIKSTETNTTKSIQSKDVKSEVKEAPKTESKVGAVVSSGVPSKAGSVVPSITGFQPKSDQTKDEAKPKGAFSARLNSSRTVSPARSGVDRDDLLSSRSRAIGSSRNTFRNSVNLTDKGKEESSNEKKEDIKTIENKTALITKKDEPEIKKEEPRKTDAELERALYERERYKRKLYADTKLHVQGLELMMMLLLTPNGFALEKLYTTSQPMLDLKINILFYLRLHINHPSNLPILGPLQAKLRESSDSAFLLLKLLSKRFFQPQMLHFVKDLGKGAFGDVMLCTLLGQSVAVKQMQVEKDISHRCIPHDIFSEILILDKWKEDQRICKLIDYGASDDFYWIVMKCYAGGSLRSWREKQIGKPLHSQLLLYLNIFEDCLNISRFFSENKVNHYDIKCDNYLLDLQPNVSQEDFINQPSQIPNFRVCLADFGTCLVYTEPEHEYTTESRGTQPIQSPEMITVNSAKKVEDRNYDRLKHHGAGQASDIWSLGCLLYEILTCEFLFLEPNFLSFLHRLTTPKAELIPQKYKDLIDNDPDIQQYLNFLLVRDPHRRPLVPECINRFKMLKEKIISKFYSNKTGTGIGIGNQTTVTQQTNNPITNVHESSSQSIPIPQIANPTGALITNQIITNENEKIERPSSPTNETSSSSNEIPLINNDLEKKIEESKKIEELGSSTVITKKTEETSNSPPILHATPPTPSSVVHPTPIHSNGSSLLSVTDETSQSHMTTSDGMGSSKRSAKISISLQTNPMTSTKRNRRLSSKRKSLIYNNDNIDNPEDEDHEPEKKDENDMEGNEEQTPEKRPPSRPRSSALESTKNPFLSGGLTNDQLEETKKKLDSHLQTKIAKTPQNQTEGNVLKTPPVTPRKESGSSPDSPRTFPSLLIDNISPRGDEKKKRLTLSSKLNSLKNAVVGDESRSTVRESTVQDDERPVTPTPQSQTKTSFSVGTETKTPLNASMGQSGIEAHLKHQSEIAEAEAVRRAKALAEIQENVILYDPLELTHFDNTPVQILPYLFLGSWGCMNQNSVKFKYGITHIVNCTKNENLFEEHFIYQKLDIDPKTVASLRNPLQSFTKFMEASHKLNGRCLVVSDNGAGPSLVIGFLMDLRKLTFFESYQEIYSRKYTLRIEAGFLQQLLSFDLEKKNKEKKKYFHCLCKRNTWISLVPFEEKPRRCSCTYNDVSFCPNTGCGVFCDQMLAQTKWKWKERVVRWGYTNRDHVQFELDNVEEYKPLYDLPPSKAKLVKPKAWTVYRCRTCLSLTHAVANNNDLKWAIVTNTE